MSAIDKLRSFAESRELDGALLRDGLSYADLREIHCRIAELEAALRGALASMDRARDILTDGKPRPACNWGLLATERYRAALSDRGNG